METSLRARSPWSSFQAACMVSRRPIWIWWATWPSLICTLSRSASLMPKPSRRPTYSCAISRQRIVGCTGDEDEMRGGAGTGDEPLAAEDAPFVAVALGARLDHAGVGTAARRGLGHGERRGDLAVDDRAEPALLLRRRAGEGEQVHVAVVGRHAVEGERPEQRARRLLVHHRPGDDRQRHAAELLRRLRRPQSGLARLLAHRREPLGGNVLVLGEILLVALERQHVLVDEGAHAHAQVLDLGRQGEVDHGGSSLGWGALIFSRAARPPGRRRPRWWRRRCSGPR